MCPIRESYCVFPTITQPFWTWLTGKPALDERPSIGSGPLRFTLMALVRLCSGIVVAIMGTRLQGAFCVLGVLLGWALSVGGARMMISTVAHQCIHSRFSGWRWIDDVTAQLFSVLTLTQSAQQYRAEHFLLHHRHDIFTTHADPATHLLIQAGLTPGTEAKRLWRRLFLSMLSPIFHVRWLYNRIHGNLMTGPLLRRVSVGLYLLGWLWLIEGAAVITGFEWLIAVGFPLLFFYQNSVLLEFISEHAWFGERDGLADPRHVHATHSWGRFCGRQVPVKRRHGLHHCLSWLAWFAEHVFYHLPVRLFVLPGDLPQHDFHHRHPGTDKWPQAAFAREADSRTLHASNWPDYQEFWGLHNAISYVFKIIALSPPPSSFKPPKPVVPAHY
ncbi:hypothetical protein [Pseudomonas sp. L1(2025)]|uniref:hypothetical protein n=1 Tax=Pseudomonas sp. L1(2025) TaxID=3449429 RepID=UPI003F69398E